MSNYEIGYASAYPVVETKICRDCGQEFDIRADEKTWYTLKGWPTPCYCKMCRGIRKWLKSKEVA